MDVNRYYIAAKPRRDSMKERDAKHTAATSRFSSFSQTNLRLPTPAAFFERQQKFKDQDKKAMMEFAQKRTVKHNLKLRRKELKSQQRKEIDKLEAKLKQPVEEEKEKVEINHEVNVKGEDGKDDTVGFEFKELKKALKNSNDHHINTNVLRTFFELKAPDRVHEVEGLLQEFKGEEFKLFDKIAKEYQVVRANSSYDPTAVETQKPRTGSFKSFKEFNVGRPNSVFLEQDLTKFSLEEEAKKMETEKKEKKPFELPAKSLRPGHGSMHSFRSMNMNKTKSLSNQSVLTIQSAALSIDANNKEVKEFQRALDTEIKDKLYTGEYVTSILERGGRWWVNRDAPKVHPSQRRRNTLLDDLRNGKVPLSI